MSKDFNIDLNSVSEEKNGINNNIESSKVHFRCPTCSKLFAAKAAYIHEEKPEFTCNSCDTDFWISFPQALSMNEVVGYKIIKEKTKTEYEELKAEIFAENLHIESFVNEENNSVKENENETKTEAEAKTQVVKAKTDPSIFEDLKNLVEEVDRSDLEFIENGAPLKPRDPEVADFWSNILGDYGDMSLHDEFINYCNEVDDIGYAAKKYQSMLEVNKHDKTARKYLNKITHTASMAVENASLATKDEMEKIGRLGAWSSGLIGVGALFVVVGFTFVQLKNLVGLGIALIFFTFAMQALLSKN